MAVDCKIYESYKDDIKSLKYPEFDFMPPLLRGQGYPTLTCIFLRFGIITSYNSKLLFTSLFLYLNFLCPTFYLLTPGSRSAS